MTGFPTGDKPIHSQADETARLLEPDRKESAKEKGISSLAQSTSSALQMPAADVQAIVRVPKTQNDISTVNVEEIVRNVKKFYTITADQLIDALKFKKFERTWGGIVSNLMGKIKVSLILS